MENENRIEQLRRLKRDLLVVYGIVITLFIVAAAGDTALGQERIPIGWFGLWLLTTLGSFALGTALLIAPKWRRVDLLHRRGTALGYLLVGLINLMSLSFHILHITPGAPIFVCPVSYAILLLVIYAHVTPSEEKIKEELFP
jgi:hypothetical protein